MTHGRERVKGKWNQNLADAWKSYLQLEAATEATAAPPVPTLALLIAGIPSVRIAMVPVMAMMDGRQRAAWNAWSTHCPRAPHLFIFSERDKMVPPQDIQAFADEHAVRVRALGLPVQVDKWESGQHCGLLRVSKHRYVLSVLRFLQNCA